MNSTTAIMKKITEKVNLLHLKHESELADLEDYLRREVIHVKTPLSWVHRRCKMNRAYKNLNRRHLEESNALIEEINRLPF
jgi:hypothetical protein